MKVALCLYGQPRRAQEGHAILSQFMRRHPDVHFDVYLHTWYDPAQTHYDASPWRPIPPADLRVHADVLDFVLHAYRPVAHRVEAPRTFEIPNMETSLLFENSGAAHRRNLNNYLSQLYSRQSVRDLLVTSGRTYDLVVGTRFDFLNPIALDLHAVDPASLHVANFHLPRKLFPDNFLVASPDIFAHLFDAYQGLPSIMNDAQLLQRIQNEYHEAPVLATENVLLAQFLTRYTIDQVVYTPHIPDFR
jgi:hypothetical protein